MKNLTDQTRQVTARISEKAKQASTLSDEAAAESNRISEVTDRISERLNVFRTE